MAFHRDNIYNNIIPNVSLPIKIPEQNGSSNNQPLFRNTDASSKKQDKIEKMNNSVGFGASLLSRRVGVNPLQVITNRVSSPTTPQAQTSQMTEQLSRQDIPMPDAPKYIPQLNMHHSS